MARNYRQEYLRRTHKAVEEGYSGYGQKRRAQDAEIDRIMQSDPIFRGLPDEQQTRSNAVLYRQGFYYTGHGTSVQRAARKRLLRGTEGNLDVGTWGDYYKDVIYPALTGQQYEGWTPTVVKQEWQAMTPDMFDEME